MLQKSVIFIDISPYHIQHKFFVYFFRAPVMEPAKILILFDIPKMSLGLD